MIRGNARGSRVDRTGSSIAAAGTTVVHAAAFFFLFGLTPDPEPMQVMYAVKLLAAPEVPEVRRPEAVQRQADPPPELPPPDVQEAPPEEVTPPPPPPELQAHTIKSEKQTRTTWSVIPAPVLQPRRMRFNSTTIATSVRSEHNPPKEPRCGDEATRSTLSRNGSPSCSKRDEAEDPR